MLLRYSHLAGQALVKQPVTWGNECAGQAASTSEQQQGTCRSAANDEAVKEDKLGSKSRNAVESGKSADTAEGSEDENAAQQYRIDILAYPGVSYGNESAKRVKRCRRDTKSEARVSGSLIAVQ